MNNLIFTKVVIPGDKLVAFIDENPEAVDPSLAKQTPKSVTNKAEEIKEATTVEDSMDIDKETSDDTKAQEVKQVNGDSENKVDDEPTKEVKSADGKEDNEDSMEVDEPVDTGDANTEVQAESLDKVNFFDY